MYKIHSYTEVCEAFLANAFFSSKIFFHFLFLMFCLPCEQIDLFYLIWFYVSTLSPLMRQFSLSLYSQNERAQIKLRCYFFVDTTAKFGLILCVHLFISVCLVWPWLIFLTCSNSLWQTSLVLLSHWLQRAQAFLQSLSLFLFSVAMAAVTDIT